jgi:hypothetical protein
MDQIQSFQNFILLEAKKYINTEESKFRMFVFKKNLERIKIINLNVSRNFIMKMNKFGDLTEL